MWLEFIQDSYRNNTSFDKYVLVYDFFQNNNQIKTLAQKFALENNYKIISVNDNGNLPYADVNISNASPFEFLIPD